MKKINNSMKAILIIAFLALPFSQIFAGNPQRAGQAGASQLLINPWARSSGWADANIAGVKGVESMFTNVAGLAFTKKTELVFSTTSWLQMNGFNDAVSNISAFGFAQKIGESGALGLSIMNMSFGDIEITTVDNPEGGIGFYTPTLMNISLSYAQIFSNNIYGGMTIKMISEQTSNMGANGIALDAGIQYVTGDEDNFRFGIALKNVGPRISFKGDGLSFRGIVGDDDGYKMTVEQRSSELELPARLDIGLSYDINILRHRITGAGTFTSNSFQKDQYRIGGEYSYREMFMLRAGYTYEEGIRDPLTRTTALTGPSAGFTLELPMGETTFGLDYSYRHTDPFQGSHSIGACINL
jgi:hypothetical protein